MMPPSNFLTASMSESMLSMSRWLVGSSRSSTCGLDHVALQNATRLFCPPDSVRMRCVCHCPDIPNRPMRRRTSSGVMVGSAMRPCSSRCSSGLWSRLSWSMWCCVKQATRRWWLRSTSPLLSRSCPVMSFTSVLFPLPFLPSRPMRVVRSMLKLRPVKMGASATEYRNVTSLTWMEEAPPCMRSTPGNVKLDSPFSSSGNSADCCGPS
mmetsp:Transcript_28339/g.72856  ORF Transcript_28339/g.72856 Transcript_28339/m.72856 type:complete len:209 (+) Transcript_28339:482-1108(+)